MVTIGFISTDELKFDRNIAKHLNTQQALFSSECVKYFFLFFRNEVLNAFNRTDIRSNYNTLSNFLTSFVEVVFITYLIL